MSEVTLLIGGKHYTLACAPGEEDRVKRLGVQIDRKLSELGENLAASPAQNLVFAALLLADELDEARSGSGDSPTNAAFDESKRNVEQLKLELEALRTEHDEAVRELATVRQASAQDSSKENADEFADLAEKLADRLEACATKLEAAGDTP